MRQRAKTRPSIIGMNMCLVHCNSCTSHNPKRRPAGYTLYLKGSSFISQASHTTSRLHDVWNDEAEPYATQTCPVTKNPLSQRHALLRSLPYFVKACQTTRRRDDISIQKFSPHTCGIPLHNDCCCQSVQHMPCFLVELVPQSPRIPFHSTIFLDFPLIYVPFLHVEPDRMSPPCEGRVAGLKNVTLHTLMTRSVLQ